LTLSDGLTAQNAGCTLQGLDVVLELENLGLSGLDGFGDLAHFVSFAHALGALGLRNCPRFGTAACCYPPCRRLAATT